MRILIILILLPLLIISCKPYKEILHHMYIKQDTHIKPSEFYKKNYYDGYILKESMPISYFYEDDYVIEILTPMKSTILGHKLILNIKNSDYSVESPISNKKKDGSYMFYVHQPESKSELHSKYYDGEYYSLPITIKDKDENIVDIIVIKYKYDKVSEKLIFEGI